MRYRNFLIIPFLILSCAAAVARPDKRKSSKSKSDDQQVERSSPADSRVEFSACLESGNITVHGWDKKEVRARVTDGMAIDFQPAGASAAAPPKELTLMMAGRRGAMKSCVSFGALELYVPRDATVNLQSGDAEISVSDVGKVRIETQNGAVTVERASRGVEVSTLGGGISVSNSKGSIKVHSVGGGIDLDSLAPSLAGDVCEAITVGGEISVTQVSHAQVNLQTVGSDVTFKSALARGGRYSFQTISGDLRVTLPADSSFRVNATLQGEIDTDFPLKISTASPELPNNSKKHRVIPQLVEGRFGTGDALITLSTFNGSVQLRKE
ncbi:MAG: DUF4097 family beta strand repeat-containing protein [Acidobacteriota bacterium]